MGLPPWNRVLAKHIQQFKTPQHLTLVHRLGRKGLPSLSKITASNPIYLAISSYKTASHHPIQFHHIRLYPICLQISWSNCRVQSSPVLKTEEKMRWKISEEQMLSNVDQIKLSRPFCPTLAAEWPGINSPRDGESVLPYTDRQRATTTMAPKVHLH